MNVDITIGIPVYRAADYIRNTLLSALEQTYPNVEILVVDDCGGDGSMQVVCELQQTHWRGACIRILRNDCKRGVGATRNRIVDEARGSYLYFLDSDDVIEPNTLQLLMDAALQSQAEVVYASYEVVDKVNGTPPRAYRKPSLQLTGPNALAEYSFKHQSVFQITVCNCLVQMDFLRATGVRFIDAMFWEDMAFTYELVTKVNRSVLLPDITYHYLCRPGSLSNYQDREILNKEEIQRNATIINYLKSKCSVLKGKPYLAYYCNVLQVNSFYIVCHIWKRATHIVPRYTYRELRQIMRHPLPLATVLRFRHKLVGNLGFWLLGRLPIPLFVALFWIIGKLKRAL